MKVILNKDLAPLGEEGDVKDVAKGYARNYLFPRGIALPYNDRTIKLFEGRREEIENRKVQKRSDAAGLKEKLESLELSITMPAGANGKLYGAVTSQTIADELAKHGYQIERKRIELATGANIKNVGKYKVTVKLYESAAAELTLTVIGQEIKTESKSPQPSRPGRKRRDNEPREPRAEEAKQPEAAVQAEPQAAQESAEKPAETTEAAPAEAQASEVQDGEEAGTSQQE